MGNRRKFFVTLSGSVPDAPESVMKGMIRDTVAPATSIGMVEFDGILDIQIDPPPAGSKNKEYPW